MRKIGKSHMFEGGDVKHDLKNFYNHEAKKYAQTRKKHWKEEDLLLEIVGEIFDKHDKIFKGQRLNILEFGCGSGRFATFLNKYFEGKFDYVGIDLSREIISYAKKDNPGLDFKVGDISELILTFHQESFDLIVGTSSFQHIPSKQERSFLMKNFYRLLRYEGNVLMTNRTLSSRFKKKYKKAVLKSFLQSIFMLDPTKKRDIMVPRTDQNGEVFERFYHFFSLEELQTLSKFSGFSAKICTFIDENGNKIKEEQNSRSSLFLVSKTPIEI